MAYEEAQCKIGRWDYLKLKVMGYSLLKFVLTTHLFHREVSEFELISIGRTRSVEGIGLIDITRQLNSVTFFNELFAAEIHHVIRAAYLMPKFLGPLARDVLRLTPQTNNDGNVLYNFNMSVTDLAALEEFQSFGDQFNPRARAQYLNWIRLQWHATSESAPDYLVPDHAQCWADLYSAFIGARYVDGGLAPLDTCHSCWDIDGGLIHRQLLCQLPPISEVDPKNDLQQLLMNKTGNTLLKLEYRVSRRLHPVN